MTVSNNVSGHQVRERPAFSRAVTILQDICEQWGMPWSELKLDGEAGAPGDRRIVRLAITAEFLREIESQLPESWQVSGFGKPNDWDGLRMQDVAMLLGVSYRTVHRHLREIRRWQKPKRDDRYVARQVDEWSLASEELAT